MKKRARKRYKGSFKWSELKCGEGGRGHNLTSMLKSDGIKATRDYSPYVGHVGILIEVHNKREAKIVANHLGTRVDVIQSWLVGNA